MKRCPECGVEKPLDEFGILRSVKSGRRGKCKKCHAAYLREWAKKNPDVIRERNRKRYENYERGRFLEKKYGVSIEVYNEMLEEQGGVCAVCRLSETYTTRGTVRSLSVDHDHQTGAIRGLLCSRCNSALGMADDDPERLRAMADYIETHANQVESNHA